MNDGENSFQQIWQCPNFFQAGSFSLFENNDKSKVPTQLYFIDQIYPEIILLTILMDTWHLCHLPPSGPSPPTEQSSATRSTQACV